MRRADMPRHWRRYGGSTAFTYAEWDAHCAKFNNRCAYCGKERRLVAEHVVPKSLGGRDVKANVVPACQSCNGQKGGLLLLEWIMCREGAMKRNGPKRSKLTAIDSTHGYR